MRRAAARQTILPSKSGIRGADFLLTERQLHRGVDRGGERLLIEAAQPMFGVDQMIAGVELSVGLHHRLLPQRALCTQLPLV
ncbi:hypothetical protein KPZU09_32770 [Klebsiella pneumoniae]|uniref:Uncharacterized protein n=1 Tax=Klebsiella pneumoniae TaxID=573 RepID=A0A919HRH6_KLEPN|nr:hypothetical protein KPZU09_32770 [Klebsiella pneumoniae]